MGIRFRLPISLALLYFVHKEGRPPTGCADHHYVHKLGMNCVYSLNKDSAEISVCDVSHVVIKNIIEYLQGLWYCSLLASDIGCEPTLCPTRMG